MRKPKRPKPKKAKPKKSKPNAKPKIEVMQPPPGARPGDGAADFTGDVTAVRARPVYNITTEEVDYILTDVIAKLLEDPSINLYVRDGVVSRIDDAKIKMLTTTDATIELITRFGWRSGKGKTASMATPASRFVDMVLNAPALYKALPVVESVTACPTFSADGRFETEPGYHVSTQTFYAPRPGFVLPAVPDEPTDDDLARAKSLILDDVLLDFPFTGDAEKAHAVAMLVLGFVRPMLEGGDAPMHVFDAPAAGTGKGLLADALTHIITGQKLPVSPEAGTVEEWRKKIFALLLQGQPVISFDNLHDKLTSPALAALLTGGGLQDRILGESRVIDAKNRSILVGTGNNVTVHFELTRRIAWTRLEVPDGRPLKRSRQFKHENLLEWILANRAELVWSVAVLVKRWIADGRPAPTWKRPSYVKWSEVIGGVLLSASIDGFNGNFESRGGDEVDPQAEAFARFTQIWSYKYQDRPVNVNNLFQSVYDVGSDLLPDVRASDQIGVKRALGKLITSKAGGRYGEYFVRKTDIKTDGYIWWRLEKAQS